MRPLPTAVCGLDLLHYVGPDAAAFQSCCIWKLLQYVRPSATAVCEAWCYCIWKLLQYVRPSATAVCEAWCSCIWKLLQDVRPDAPAVCGLQLLHYAALAAAFEDERKPIDLSLKSSLFPT
jgi:hypothetical protein